MTVVKKIENGKEVEWLACDECGKKRKIVIDVDTERERAKFDGWVFAKDENWDDCDMCTYGRVHMLHPRYFNI